jgi:F0F1-type ATP synthase assembly protein I
MWIVAARVSAAVLEIAGGVMVGLYGGQFVGGRFGSPDIGLYVGGGLGLFAAVMGLRRLVRMAKREDQ